MTNQRSGKGQDGQPKDNAKGCNEAAHLISFYHKSDGVKRWLSD